jgi:serine protease Do
VSSPPVLPPWVCAIGSGRVRALRARTMAVGFLVLAASIPLFTLAPPAAAQFPIRQLHQAPTGPYIPARPVSGPAKSDPQQSVTPHPSVARITVIEKDGISYGSGTLVDSRGQFGLVVTNWHVIRDAAGHITVEFPDGFKSAAQVAKTDKDWDLAALSIARPNATPVPVSAAAPQPGEPLTIAGYGSGDYRLASGQCTQYLAPGIDLPYEMVELSAEARQGDSGGPIFNQKGELAGVLFGSGPGYTSGSYGGRVLRFLTTVVPGGLPGSDGAAAGSIAMSPPIAPPPQATALHQPVVPFEAPAGAFGWGPPANRLPEDGVGLTPAASAAPDSLLAPPAREALSERFGPVESPVGDIDPKAAVELERMAANTPLEITPTPIGDRAAGTSQLQSSLPPRDGLPTAPTTDFQSAPADQLLAAAWQKIGGPSVIDQIKTVLAGIGILGIVILFFRMGRRAEPEVDVD